uniref:Transcriptional regulator n=1 Tax=Gongylonema pulchrum TaxID=637853 RepID=A0A183EJL1_9BILA
LCIEMDCDDVSEFEEDGQTCYELICARNKLASVTNALTERGFNIRSSALGLRATQPVEITEDDSAKVRQLYEMLRESDNITQVYDNIRPDFISLRPVKLKVTTTA